MIRNLLATTAVATLIATGAMAQTAPAPAPTAPAGQGMQTEQAAPTVVRAEGHLASNIIGQNVYNGTGDDAENIGEVNDIVIGTDNQLQAVVIGVGGFLGLGQKDVAIEYDLVEWAERDGDRFLVVQTSADALKAQAEFDRRAYEPTAADEDVAEVKPATAEDLANAPVEADDDASDDMAAAPATDAPATTAPAGGMAAAPAPSAEAPAGNMAAAPAGEAADAETDNTQTAAIDRSTLNEMQAEQITADNLEGTTVYGAGDENVGEIGEVVLNTDGGVDAVIIDVGGFLGMGEKEVAVSMDNLTFMSDEDGDMYLYTSFTKEQLEAQPEYDEATFADNRDGMLLTNPVQ